MGEEGSARERASRGRAVSALLAPGCAACRGAAAAAGRCAWPRVPGAPPRHSQAPLTSRSSSWARAGSLLDREPPWGTSSRSELAALWLPPGAAMARGGCSVDATTSRMGRPGHQERRICRRKEGGGAARSTGSCQQDRRPSVAARRMRPTLCCANPLLACADTLGLRRVPSSGAFELNPPCAAAQRPPPLQT